MSARGRSGLISYGPAGLFAAGLALVVAAVLTGEAEASLVVIIPVMSGSGPLMLGGVAMMILGFLSGFAVLASRGLRSWEDGPADAPRDGHGEKQKAYGGLIMVGPIPIAFGSDRSIARIMMVVGIAIAALVVIALLI